MLYLCRILYLILNLYRIVSDFISMSDIVSDIGYCIYVISMSDIVSDFESILYPSVCVYLSDLVSLLYLYLLIFCCIVKNHKLG